MKLVRRTLRRRTLPLLAAAFAAGGLPACGPTAPVQAHGRSDRTAPPREHPAATPAPLPRGEDHYKAVPEGLFSGPAVAAYLFLQAAGVHTAVYDLARRALPPGAGRVPLARMAAHLRRQGLVVHAGRIALPDLLAGSPPALLLLRPDRPAPPGAGRFVLWRGRYGDRLLLVDPLRGPATLEPAALAARYLGVALLPAAPPPPLKTPRPDLAPTELLYDFGEVEAGTILTHAFQVRNAGRLPLTVRRVEVSCGCAAALLHRTPDLTPALRERLRRRARTKRAAGAAARGTIPPGETRWVLALVDTTGKTGRQAFAVRLTTNDPDEAELSLVLHGRVLPRYEVDPPCVWFQNVPAAGRAVRHVWVRRPHGGPMRFVRLTVNHPALTAALDPDAPRTPWHPTHPVEAKRMPPRPHPAAEGWVAVALRLRPDARPGRLAATLRLELEGGRLYVPVAGTLVGNLVCDPPNFAFGRVRRGRPATAVVTLRSRRGGGLVVQEIETGADYLEVTAAPVAPGVYRLTARLRPGWRVSTLSGFVRVHTNDPLEPVKRIDFFGFVER